MLFQGANAESQGTSRPAAQGKKKQATEQGFRLSHEPQLSEELQKGTLALFIVHLIVYFVRN